MTTIYDTEDLTVTKDEDAITISLFGERMIEMTEAEFRSIIEAYQNA